MQQALNSDLRRNIPARAGRIKVHVGEDDFILKIIARQDGIQIFAANYLLSDRQRWFI
jgi:hypothetical protein